MKRSLGVLLGLVMAVLVAGTASAQPITASAGSPRPPMRTVTASAKHEASVAAQIRKHAQVGKTLYYSRAWRVTHDKTILRHYMKGVRTAHGRIVGAPASMMLGSRPPAFHFADPACPGVNNVSVHWYGWRWMLDNCNTIRLTVLAGTAAAVIGFLATLLPKSPQGSVMIGIAGVVFALGAGGLTWCDARQRGVKIYKYTTAIFAFWCETQ